MHKIKLFTTVLIALALFALPGVGAAGSRDRDRDRMPDRWEKRHGLSTKKNDARRDRDRDGLSNLDEYRSHTDPSDADSDDDGTDDGDERAGVIASFEKGVLTVELSAGGSVSGKVTDETDIDVDCDRGHDGDREHDQDDEDKEAHSSHKDDCDGNEDLVPGSVVRKAELELTSAGAAFEEIELVK